VLRPACLADPADEQRHVGTLPAAVGVQLVQHEEVQAGGHPDEALAVLGPGEHQLQHHVVGEQDVRRVVPDRPAARVVLLAGVAGEGDRLPTRPVAVAQELLQLLDLAVGQRVHRVDDDRPDPPAGLPGRAVPQHPVDDGHDVGE
jgi:hypothetical protein